MQFFQMQFYKKGSIAIHNLRAVDTTWCGCMPDDVPIYNGNLQRYRLRSLLSL